MTCSKYVAHALHCIKHGCCACPSTAIDRKDTASAHVYSISSRLRLYMHMGPVYIKDMYHDMFATVFVSSNITTYGCHTSAAYVEATQLTSSDYTLNAGLGIFPGISLRMIMACCIPCASMAPITYVRSLHVLCLLHLHSPPPSFHYGPSHVLKTSRYLHLVIHCQVLELSCWIGALHSENSSTLYLLP